VRAITLECASSSASIPHVVTWHHAGAMGQALDRYNSRPRKRLSSLFVNSSNA